MVNSCCNKKRRVITYAAQHGYMSIIKLLSDSNKLTVIPVQAIILAANNKHNLIATKLFLNKLGIANIF